MTRKDVTIDPTAQTFDTQSITDISDTVATPTYRFLLNTLRPVTRSKILGSLIADDLRPTWQDWTNIYFASQPVDPVEGSPFDVVFFLSGLLSAFFVVTASNAAYRIIRADFFKLTLSTTSAVIIIVAGIAVLSWQWIIVLKNKSQRAGLLQEYGFVAVPLALPVAYLIEAFYHLALDIRGRLARRRDSTNMFPASVRFVKRMGTDYYSLALYLLLSLPSVLALFTIASFLSGIFLSAVWTASTICWIQGKRRIRAINNPLCGCLDLENEIEPSGRRKI